ncbi:MAG: BMP family ABC transporter substrate-binding protein [Lachnospiraceae bacterium]|nr:BMP family ABC transporter substrate-binding protein [Lachnospiraceae bacterium]
MKKLAIFASVIFLVVIAGLVMIRDKKAQTDVTQNKTKVGVILNSTCDDHTWGQSHYEGIEACKKELNLEVTYRENVTFGEECVSVIEDMINEGCKIIIATSFEFGEDELAMSEKYPDVFFMHATGVVENRNMATYFGRIYQMRYLSGIVAGLQTETNSIGYVAAMPISEVNRGINAFTLGVRSVNPDATVYVTWTNDWSDDDATEAATEKLFKDYKDIDVVSMHTDSRKVLDYAEANGIWSIGYNIDNSEYYPNSYLTAPIWHWDAFYKARILEILQGKFQGIHYWEGVETGLVDLAPLTDNVKEGTKEVVEAEFERIKNCEFDVFDGPITDNEGTLRVNEGETMTDDIMLNEFDWYVEGVVIDE